MKQLFVILLVGIWTSVAVAAPEPDLTLNIEDTRHDFAIFLPLATPEEGDRTQCIFCHPPQRHSLDPGRWVRMLPDHLLEYPYDRPEDAAAIGKPDGSSLICLGCHDGTIALGDVFSRSVAIEIDRNVDRADFADGHPVSIPFGNSTGPAGRNHRLVDLSSLSAEMALDSDGKLQCTTCHDPHDDTFGDFLVVDDWPRTLCTQCHVVTNWEDSSHNTSTATWNYRDPAPWPYADAKGTVAEHGCANCHTPHSAGDGRYLLNHRNEEDNCLACHNGNVAGADIRAEFSKISSHPVALASGRHRADESIVLSDAERHVECTDCHDPHATAAGDLRGIDVSGVPQDRIEEEYQLCFRCHGDGISTRAPPTPRVHDQSNVRLQFDTSNPSFHPVTGPGNNPDVPSLIAPLAENSLIACSDCHANDNGTRAGGLGPDGPHGSIYASLLVRNYEIQDRQPESPVAYALCYRCHNRGSILADESFPLHRLHVSDEAAPCNVCHDPHGISLTQGDSVNASHLINFDTSVVFPNSGNELRFEDRGIRAGACFLACHNSNHDGLSYD